MKKLLFLLILPFLVIGQNSTFVPDDASENLLISLGYDDVLDNFQSRDIPSEISEKAVLAGNALGGWFQEQYLLF